MASLDVFIRIYIRAEFRRYGLSQYISLTDHLADRLIAKNLGVLDMQSVVTEEYLTNYIHERMTAK